ncbi:MAG TPA: LppX_LprAFG lipoprotein [Pseudonocardiaceae bacterium]|jgi:lipoprotein LprG
MPRRRLRFLALLAAVSTTVLTACGSSGPLPDGSRLLSQSATSMRSLNSAKADIQVDGTLPGLPIKSANGVLTKEGSAKGTVSLDMGKQPFELAFVVIGQDVYLKGPTGGFRKLSSSLPYDPRLIMDPKRGIAGVLSSGTDVQTEDHEQANGVDSYKVQVKFPQKAVGGLVPGYDPSQPSEVWIASSGFRLVQGEFPTTDGKVTFRLSDFNAPTDIKPPI